MRIEKTIGNDAVLVRFDSMPNYFYIRHAGKDNKEDYNVLLVIEDNKIKLNEAAVEEFGLNIENFNTPLIPEYDYE